MFASKPYGMLVCVQTIYCGETAIRNAAGPKIALFAHFFKAKARNPRGQKNTLGTTAHLHILIRETRGKMQLILSKYIENSFSKFDLVSWEMRGCRTTLFHRLTVLSVRLLAF